MTHGDGAAPVAPMHGPARAAPVPGQAVTGLALAALIVGAWLGLHLYAMFGTTLAALGPLGVGAIVLVQTWLSVGLFIVAHDAMHGTLAPGRPRLNAAIGALLLWVYAGFSWRRMLAAHTEHHRAPGTADDPDFDAAHPARFWPWYGTFLRRYFGVRPALHVSAVVALYVLGFHVAWAQVVLLYGVPAIASSLQLFYFGTYRPHRHAERGFVDRHNARSERFGPVLSLLTCFHFGYHHAHHLAPWLPWWALPARRAGVEAGAAGR